MRKIASVLLILMLSALAYGASLSFEDSDLSFSLYTDHISYNSSTGYMRGRFGPLTAGSLAGDWNLFSIVDSYAYVWKEHLVQSSSTVRGLSLSGEGMGMWAVDHPQRGFGYLVESHGFHTGFALFAEKDVDERLLRLHRERYGQSAALYTAGWSTEHFLIHFKLSWSESYGLDALISTGLSYRDLSFVYIRGNEANVLKKSRSAQEAWHLLLDTRTLSFHLSITRYNEPVRLGTYRRWEGKAEASIHPASDVLFKSSLSTVFTEEGAWQRDAAFSFRWDFITLSWDVDDGFGVKLKLGSVEVAFEKGGYSMVYRAEGDWWRMALGLASDGSIETSFSVEFS